MEWQKGKIEGEVEGRKEGRMEERHVITRKLLLEGMGPAKISAITGLTLEGMRRMRKRDN